MQYNLKQEAWLFTNKSVQIKYFWSRSITHIHFYIVLPFPLKHSLMQCLSGKHRSSALCQLRFCNEETESPVPRIWITYPFPSHLSFLTHILPLLVLMVQHKNLSEETRREVILNPYNWLDSFVFTWVLLFGIVFDELVYIISYRVHYSSFIVSFRTSQDWNICTCFSATENFV